MPIVTGYIYRLPRVRLQMSHIILNSTSTLSYDLAKRCRDLAFYAGIYTSGCSLVVPKVTCLVCRRRSAAETSQQYAAANFKWEKIPRAVDIKVHIVKGSCPLQGLIPQRLRWTHHSSYSVMKSALLLLPFLIAGAIAAAPHTIPRDGIMANLFGEGGPWSGLIYRALRW